MSMQIASLAARGVTASKAAKLSGGLTASKTLLMARRAWNAADLVLLADFSIDVVAGKDVFLNDDITSVLSLGSLGGRGLVTLASTKKKFALARENGASVSEAMKKASSFTPTGMNAARSASRMAWQLASNPKLLLATLVASNMPRVINFTRSMGLIMGKGAVYKIVRDVKSKSYLVVGKNGDVLMTVSTKGIEANTKLMTGAVRSNAKIASVGTLLGLDLILSDDPVIIKVVSQFIEIQAQALFPDQAIYPSRGYSNALDAHVTEVLRDPDYHVSRLRSTTGASSGSASDTVAAEIVEGLRRCLNDTGSVEAVGAEQPTWIDDIISFFTGEGTGSGILNNGISQVKEIVVSQQQGYSVSRKDGAPINRSAPGSTVSSSEQGGIDNGYLF